MHFTIKGFLFSFQKGYFWHNFNFCNFFWNFLQKKIKWKFCHIFEFLRLNWPKLELRFQYLFLPRQLKYYKIRNVPLFSKTFLKCWNVFPLFEFLPKLKKYVPKSRKKISSYMRIGKGKLRIEQHAPPSVQKLN